MARLTPLLQQTLGWYDIPPAVEYLFIVVTKDGMSVNVCCIGETQRQSQLARLTEGGGITGLNATNYTQLYMTCCCASHSEPRHSECRVLPGFS